ncbi:hypothetical protein GGI12_000776 [Dipsacomyces acuminosporus]|nr:hypothetical protein GGI12_000776 [Dipsacomyces acuminosporus]
MSQQASHIIQGHSSSIGAGFNVVNTIIGSGILALPYALKEAGFYFGVFTLVFIAFLCNFSLNTLIYSGRRVGLYKYESVSEAALGRKGHYLLSFALTINSIGSCISYLIIVGDITTVIAQNTFGVNLFTSRQSVILIAAFGFTLPLLFFRTLEPLVKPSTLSILCLPVIVLIVAVRGPAYTLPEPVPTPVFGNSVLPAMGVIAFAYASTQTSFQNYQTLKNKTLAAWHKATLFASGTAVIIYLAFSIISYKSFGLATQPNLLNNFSTDDALANVARVLLAFTLTLTYPMQFYPIRDLLGESLGFSLDGPRSSAIKFHAFSLVLFASTLITALTVDDLGFVFKLIGTAASSLLVFGLPGIIYLRLVSPYKWAKLSTGAAAATTTIAADNEVPVADETTALLGSEAGSEAEQVAADISRDPDIIPEPSTTVTSVFLLMLGVCVFVIGTWTSIHEFVSA